MSLCYSCIDYLVKRLLVILEIVDSFDHQYNLYSSYIFFDSFTWYSKSIGYRLNPRIHTLSGYLGSIFYLNKKIFCRHLIIIRLLIIVDLGLMNNIIQPTA